MVDLSMFKPVEQKKEIFSRDYLASFDHFAINWDARAKSSNLELSYSDDLSGGVITSKTSLNSFKTIYANEAFPVGSRNYFEIRFLHGCNFKIGVCETNTAVENAFCD